MERDAALLRLVVTISSCFRDIGLLHGCRELRQSPRPSSARNRAAPQGGGHLLVVSEVMPCRTFLSGRRKNYNHLRRSLMIRRFWRKYRSSAARLQAGKPDFCARTRPHLSCGVRRLPHLRAANRGRYQFLIADAILSSADMVDGASGVAGYSAADSRFCIASSF